MRSVLALLLVSSLGATAPRVQPLTADLLIGPGRAPRPGDAAFRPSLEVLVSVTGLRPGEVPEFGLWRGARSRKARIRAASVAPEGADRYRIVAHPDRGTGGTLIVALRLRGRWTAPARIPIRVHALPAPHPRPGQDVRQ